MKRTKKKTRAHLEDGFAEQHTSPQDTSTLSSEDMNIIKQPAPSLLRRRPLSSSPPVLSFQELQRLNATKMEFFGFAGWLASTLFYVLFFMWAYLPDATLDAYGFTYYPSKHWALAVPSMIVMTYLFSLVIYKAVNLLGTPPLHSYATVLDSHSVFLEDEAIHAHGNAATPPICDIPIFQVNSHMLDSVSS